MEIINNTLIITFSAAGVVSGFLLLLLAYAYYRGYKADRITKELVGNRLESYFHGMLNFSRR
ncbi:MAG: hypothetical protein MUC95_05930 [Spirochaetes bacterium]|jgi:hypothetical protein|nr:hypothetical protein [Spirochaetota bacterium]